MRLLYYYRELYTSASSWILHNTVTQKLLSPSQSFFCAFPDFLIYQCWEYQPTPAAPITLSLCQCKWAPGKMWCLEFTAAQYTAAFAHAFKERAHIYSLQRHRPQRPPQPLFSISCWTLTSCLLSTILVSITIPHFFQHGQKSQPHSCML